MVNSTSYTVQNTGLGVFFLLRLNLAIILTENNATLLKWLTILPTI